MFNWAEDIIFKLLSQIVEFLMVGTAELMAWLYRTLLLTTTPDLSADFVSEWAGRMFTIGIATGALFLMFQIGQMVITGGRNRMSAFDMLMGFAAFMIITPAVVILIALLQAGIDSMNSWLVDLVNEDMKQLPDELNKLIDRMPDVFSAGILTHFMLLGSFIAAGISMLGGLLLWMLFVIREYLVYLLAIMAPIVLSGLTWRVTATWVRKWLPILISLLVTPLFVTVIFGLSNSMMIEAIGNLNGWLDVALEADDEVGKLLNKDPSAGPAPAHSEDNPGKILSLFVISGASFFIALFSPWVLYKVMTEWLNLRDQAIGLEQAAGSKVMSSGKDLSRKILAAGAAASTAGVGGPAAGAAAKGSTAQGANAGVSQQAASANTSTSGERAASQDNTSAGSSGNSSSTGLVSGEIQGAGTHYSNDPADTSQSSSSSSVPAPAAQSSPPTTGHATSGQASGNARGNQTSTQVSSNAQSSSPDSSGSPATQTQVRQEQSQPAPQPDKPGLLHVREPKVKFPPMPPGHGQSE